MKSVSLGLHGLKRGALYLWKHPHLLMLSLSQCLLHRRLLVPLDALRWALRAFLPKNLPLKKWQIRPSAPGVRLHAEVEVMEQLISLQAVVRVKAVKLSEQSAQIVIELSDVSVDAPKDSPIAGMLDMVDLKKPGLLFAWLPSTPSWLVDTSESTVVIDLAKLPLWDQFPSARRILAASSHVLSIRDVRVGNQVVVVEWKTNMQGASKAMNALLGITEHTPHG